MMLSLSSIFVGVVIKIFIWDRGRLSDFNFKNQISISKNDFNFRFWIRVSNPKSDSGFEFGFQF